MGLPARILAVMETTPASLRPRYPNSPFQPQPEPVVETYALDDRVSTRLVRHGTSRGGRWRGSNGRLHQQDGADREALSQDDQALVRDDVVGHGPAFTSAAAADVAGL